MLLPVELVVFLGLIATFTKVQTSVENVGVAILSLTRNYAIRAACIRNQLVVIGMVG